MSRCPFTIIENFASPLLCEEIVDETGWVTPVNDIDGIPQPTVTSDESFEEMLFERLQQIVPSLEEYYQFEYKGVDQMKFEWIPTNARNPIQCESSVYTKNSWMKNKFIDFSAVLFLCDYNDQAPFDTEFECYGGKLEFPNHVFGFNPVRGTLVIYPSDPRFMNGSSIVQAGDLFQVRMNIVASTPYIYDPQQFPGTYQTWF